MSETTREQTKPAERKKVLAERINELGNSTSPLGLDTSHEPPEEPVAPKVKRARGTAPKAAAHPPSRLSQCEGWPPMPRGPPQLSPEEPSKAKRAKPAEHQKPLAERINELSRPPQLWRLPRVLEATGLRKSQLLDAVERGDFPAPVKILEGGRAVAWLDTEVVGHILSRVADRDRVLETA